MLNSGKLCSCNLLKVSICRESCLLMRIFDFPSIFSVNRPKNCFFSFDK